METFDEFEARLLKKLEAFKAQQKADVQRLEAQLAEMQQLVDEHNRKRRVARAAQLQRQVLKAQKKATCNGLKTGSSGLANKAILSSD